MVFIPDYTLNVQGEEVHFLFNYRALRRYSEAEGLELDQLYRKIQRAVTKEEDYTEELKAVKDFTIKDLPVLLSFGHESWCAYNHQPFRAGELEKDLWMDCIGGLWAQTAVFNGLILTLVRRMVSAAGEEAGEEKKRAVSGLPGESLHSEPLKVD